MYQPFESFIRQSVDKWATGWATEKYDFDSLQWKESFLYSHGVVKITL